MARYRQLQRGVFDNERGIEVLPSMYHAWKDYQQWLAAGNRADPQLPTNGGSNEGEAATQRNSDHADP